MHNARNTLIPALLALLLSIGAYVYIFREVQNAGREVSSIERQISEEHEKARRREAVRSTLTDTEADRAELDSRLVSEGSLVSFFENIEGLAIESGVETEFARISESVEIGRAHV